MIGGIIVVAGLSVEVVVTKIQKWKRSETQVRFANFLSSGFTSMALINPPERKLAKCTSVSTGLAGCVI